MYENTFLENTAGDPQIQPQVSAIGGAVYILGGKIHAVQNLFQDNETLVGGGAAGAIKGGGALYINACGEVKVHRNKFFSNSSEDGGGALSVGHSGAADIRNNVFIGNAADDEGGALWAVEGDPNIRNNPSSITPALRAAPSI